MEAAGAEADGALSSGCDQQLPSPALCFCHDNNSEGMGSDNSDFVPLLSLKGAKGQIQGKSVLGRVKMGRSKIFCFHSSLQMTGLRLHSH